MSEQTLTSLAILTVNWDEGHDLIKSFVPIVAECIRKGDDEPIGLVDLQAAVEKDAGIKIPSGALEAILHRCAREGLVRRSHKVYVPVREQLEQTNYPSTRREALQSYNLLLTRLRTFAKCRYGIKWSPEEADERLLAFLKEGSVPILAAATEGDPLPAGREQSRKAKHVLSAFAGMLAEYDPEGFAALEVVVKGFVLSGVLYYPDIGKVETRFNELEVYCDTPFLLKALGFAEEGFQVQAIDLIELLQELGAKLRCFHHTREELAGVLEAQARDLREGAESELAFDYVTSRRLRRDEIEEMIVSVDRTLGKLGVEIVDTPPWTEDLDETALEAVLDEHVRYDPERPQARRKDMRSLAAIARLRKMHRVDSFENAKAVFVTTNADLARGSSRFFQEIEGTGAIPLCLPVGMMTRLAWVKRPLSAPDLPKHILIASSYASLNPSRALWVRYLQALTRRREEGDLSDEEYQFLRTSREARQALMDTTLGKEDGFSWGTVEEVLDHAKSVMHAEAEERAKIAEEAAEQHQRDLKQFESAHRRRIDKQAATLGKVVSYGVACLLGAALVVSVLACIPGAPLVELHQTKLRIGVWVCIGIGAAVTTYTVLHRGITVAEIRSRLSKRIERAWATRGHARLDALHRTALTE